MTAFEPSKRLPVCWEPTVCPLASVREPVAVSAVDDELVPLLSAGSLTVAVVTVGMLIAMPSISRAEGLSALLIVRKSVP